MTDRLIFEECELIWTWNSWVNICWSHIFWTDTRFHPKLSTLLYHGRHADIWRVWTAKWLGILECLSVHLPSSELLNLSWPTLYACFVCLFLTRSTVVLCCLSAWLAQMTRWMNECLTVTFLLNWRTFCDQLDTPVFLVSCCFAVWTYWVLYCSSAVLTRITCMSTQN